MAREMKVAATFTIMLKEGSHEASAQVVQQAFYDEAANLSEIYLYNNNDTECWYDVALQTVELVDEPS